MNGNEVWELTGFLATLAVGVLFAAHNDRVHPNQDGQDGGQSGLHSDENNARDGLSGLCDSEFLNEDEDTDYRESSHDLDEDVDDVSAPSLIRTIPEEETQHWEDVSPGLDVGERSRLTQTFNDQLSNGLCESVSICSCQNTSLCEHVDNGWDEQPPEVLLVAIVEQAVFEPEILLVVESGCISFHCLETSRCLPDLECEEGENTSEKREGNACESFCCP